MSEHDKPPYIILKGFNHTELGLQASDKIWQGYRPVGSPFTVKCADDTVEFYQAMVLQWRLDQQ